MNLVNETNFIRDHCHALRALRSTSHSTFILNRLLLGKMNADFDYYRIQLFKNVMKVHGLRCSLICRSGNAIFIGE